MDWAPYFSRTTPLQSIDVFVVYKRLLKKVPLLFTFLGTLGQCCVSHKLDQLCAPCTKMIIDHHLSYVPKLIKTQKTFASQYFKQGRMGLQAYLHKVHIRYILVQCSFCFLFPSPSFYRVCILYTPIYYINVLYVYIIYILFIVYIIYVCVCFVYIYRVFEKKTSGNPHSKKCKAFLLLYKMFIS